MTNRRGQMVTYKYDKLGRLLKKYDPTANDSVTFAYSVAKNNVQTVADEWTGSSHVVTETTYGDSSGWTDSVRTYVFRTNKTYTQQYWPTKRFQLDSVTVGGSALTFTWAKQNFVWDTTTGLLDSSYVNSNGMRYHHTTEGLVDSTYYSGGAVQFDSVMDTHQPMLTKFTSSSLDTAFHRAYLYDSAGAWPSSTIHAAGRRESTKCSTMRWARSCGRCWVPAARATAARRTSPIAISTQV